MMFALMERQKTVERRTDLRFGLIASLLYNANRGKNAKPMMPADFFPEAAEPKEQTKAQMHAAMAEIRGLLGGSPPVEGEGEDA